MPTGGDSDEKQVKFCYMTPESPKLKILGILEYRSTAWNWKQEELVGNFCNKKLELLGPFCLSDVNRKHRFLKKQNGKFTVDGGREDIILKTGQNESLYTAWWDLLASLSYLT